MLYDICPIDALESVLVNSVNTHTNEYHNTHAGAQIHVGSLTTLVESPPLMTLTNDAMNKDINAT